MSVCAVRTQQRGPVLNIVMSTMFQQSNGCTEIGTRCINVNDLAEVRGKFKELKNDAGVYVALESKKSEAARNLIVTLNISVDGKEKRIINCQDDWVEASIGRIFNGQGSFYTQNTYVTLYTAEINITIQATAIMPVAPMTSNQLYEDTEFTDFKLKAADGVVAFHKNILFIQSEMFTTMLRGQWKESAEGSIDMHGVSVQTLQHLKDFMYLGTLPDEGLEPLLLVARCCMMDNLAAACINKLITTVKPETFDSLAEFACQNNIIELVRAFARIPDHVVNGIHWYNN